MLINRKRKEKLFKLRKNLKWLTFSLRILQSSGEFSNLWHHVNNLEDIISSTCTHQPTISSFGCDFLCRSNILLAYSSSMATWNKVRVTNPKSISSERRLSQHLSLAVYFAEAYFPIYNMEQHGVSCRSIQVTLSPSSLVIHKRVGGGGDTVVSITMIFHLQEVIWWHLVCHTFFLITFAFYGYSRSLEAHNCPLDGRETETQIGKTENHIGYQIQKTWLYFWQKQKNKC